MIRTREQSLETINQYTNTLAVLTYKAKTMLDSHPSFDKYMTLIAIHTSMKRVYQAHTEMTKILPKAPANVLTEYIDILEKTCSSAKKELDELEQH